MAGSIGETVEQTIAITLHSEDVSRSTLDLLQEFYEKFPGCLTELVIKVSKSTSSSESLDDFRKRVKKEMPGISQEFLGF
jgi:hypothetical protein